MKITRSNSRDYDGGDIRLKKHFPNNSQYSRASSRGDLITDVGGGGGDSFRAKLTHQRTASRDSNNSTSNIKYILNYLHASNPRATASKKHSRNHSYDQIYMPSNIKIDQELHRKFPKSGGRKNSRDHDVLLLQQPIVVIKSSGKELDGSDSATTTTTGQVIESIYHHHSRTNSKDLNYLVDDVASAAGLRHRRTSSKDLNRIAVEALADVCCSSSTGGRHSRTGSQHKIDDLMAPPPPQAADANLLLRPPPPPSRRTDSVDFINVDRTDDDDDEL